MRPDQPLLAAAFGVLDAIRSRGRRAVIAGGAVRDHVLGRPLTDDEPDRVPAAERRVGQEDRPGGVDAGQEPVVEVVEGRVAAAVVLAEADKPEIDRGQELEPGVRLDEFPEEPGQPDVLPDHGLKALDAVAADDEPELEGPEAAAELDAPVAVVPDLGPIVVALGMWLRRRARAGAATAAAAQAGSAPGSPHVAPVPWFLVMFLVFTLVNSHAALFGIPGSAITTLVRADLWLLCVGMAGVGLQTGFRDVTSAGWRPIALGALQWLLLALLAYGIARAIGA